MRLRLAALAIGTALLASGCAELLPKHLDEVSSPWTTFEDAKGAIEGIEPQRTTAEDLRALGLDPYRNPNVQLLSYSDILLRFPMTDPSRDTTDPGLRDCLEGGKACKGLFVTAKDIKRDRVGSFWLDTFGFKRVTETTGWNFNALILLVNDRVVYTIFGGQPNVREQEVTRQPLGPLQGIGESMGSLVK